MSTIDLDLFGSSPEDEELHPEFAKVLLGFDPRHVEEFVAQCEERITILEKQLRDTKAHLDAANRRAAAAREEAYGEVAGRMAELLRAADHQAEQLRQDTDEACKRQLADVSMQAEQIRREADIRAETMRAEAEDELTTARAEARRILGDLARDRDAVIGELQALREHLIGLIERVTGAIDAGPVAEGQSPPMAPKPLAPAIDDLLDSTAGFDLAPLMSWDDDVDVPESRPAIVIDDDDGPLFPEEHPEWGVEKG